MSREALHHSINVLCAHLDMYNLEVWSISCEWDTCPASVKELEEVLVVEESMDEETEMRQEKVRYNVKRVMTVKENVGMEKGIGVEEEKDMGLGEGESELEEKEDEPIHGFGLLVKARGKHPVK